MNYLQQQQQPVVGYRDDYRGVGRRQDVDDDDDDVIKIAPPSSENGGYNLVNDAIGLQPRRPLPDVPAIPVDMAGMAICFVVFFSVIIET